MYKISALVLIVFNIFLILIMGLSRPVGLNPTSLPREFYHDRIKPISEDEWSQRVESTKATNSDRRISHINQESMPNNSINVRVDETPKEKSPHLQTATVSSSNRCYAWGGFNVAERIKAQEIINVLRINASTTEREVREITGYWVFIPPQKNEKMLSRTIDRLQLVGEESYTVIQNERFKNLVSLGFFKLEDLAVQRLNELRQKGIKDAIMRPRERIATLSYFVINSVSGDQEQQLIKTASNFEAVSLNKISCK